MAKRKSTPKVPVVLTKEQQIQAAFEDFRSWRFGLDTSLIGEPTRFYTEGEEVGFGGFQYVRIERKISDKIYIIFCRAENKRHGVITIEEKYLATWWYEIKKLKSTELEHIYSQPDPKGHFSQAQMESLVHIYGFSGFVCDPSFQRGYVWSDADKQALISSIYERINIGSFVFVRMAGYNHREGELSHYTNLHGEPIDLARNKSYVYSVIDGQQRLRTLMEFYLDKFRFNGHLYSELAWRDRVEFHRTMVHYRIIEEEQVTRKEVLEMFLRVNRGVPQTVEHLEKIKTLLASEK